MSAARVAACVAGSNCAYAVQLLENGFRAPEASTGEDRLLLAFESPAEMSAVGSGNLAP